MLWVSLHLPHLAMELRQPQQPGPLAVTDGAGARRTVIACNTTAREAGIHIGMDAPSSLMREPELRMFDRSKADERRAILALACWAHQFTSDVCLDVARWMLWQEIGSSLRYFNSLSTVHAQIKTGIERLGYTASLGIAPTLEAPSLLTKHPDVRPILNKSEIRRTVGALPLAGLDIGPKVVDQLNTTGLRTIDELLDIPSESLARRFGEELPHYLQRLLGERADVRRRHRAPAIYRRRFDFMEGVESVDGLLFPLRRILQEFAGYLRGRDVAIQHLAVELLHREGAETVLRLVTSAPQRDAAHLFALLREKLERTPIPDPVMAIQLNAGEFVEPRITQADFFDDPHRENDNWSALLDKLRARLGADAIRRLGLSDDHRPENAWCVLSDGTGTRIEAPFPDRPLWFLSEPQQINNLPQLLGTPERIEAGWWTGQDSSRDYYLARTDEGAHWWLFREAGTNRWYLQGLWA
ncbi:MAG: protein ImuB [Gammaproteobacteria bacterium]|nr:protein ImuB [Gammaproteobacteria bacterium]